MDTCPCQPTIGRCDGTSYGRFAHAWLSIAWVYYQHVEREAEVEAEARDWDGAELR